ncbi:hypothetical protein AcW1_000951 [Taiwanofungus camphoratus]|nr:hypothetical protein AcW1_000951 [Antrodia cinnamomea]
MAAQSIRQRLMRVENDFLNAIIQGTAAVEDFDNTWSTLLQDIENTVHAVGPHDDIVSLAHVTASRIAILAQAFYDLSIDHRTLTLDIVGEMESIFSQLAIQDILPAPASISYCDHDISRDVYPEQYPFTAAYQWLIANLFNPYPSRSEKEAIAKNCGVSVISVSGWFKDIRKRIGWTALCSEQFGGSRAAIVEAACSAYSEESPCSVAAEVMHRFMAIKSNTLRLSNDTFVRGGRIVSLQPNFADSHLFLDVKAQTRIALEHEFSASLPEPEQSLHLSCTPSLVSWQSSDGGDDEGFSEPNIGNKRTADELHRGSESETHMGRVRKRLRTEDASSSGHADFSCSTPLSIDVASESEGVPLSSDYLVSQLTPIDAFIETDRGTPHLSLLETVETSNATVQSAPLRRKRRLSDTHDCPYPKRPCSLPAGPRLHAVSDPLPLVVNEDAERSSVLNSWSMFNFDSPEVVSIAHPDPSAIFDIEVSNGWVSDSAKIDRKTFMNDPERAVGGIEQLNLPVEVDLKGILVDGINAANVTTQADDGFVESQIVALNGFLQPNSTTSVAIAPSSDLIPPEDISSFSSAPLLPLTLDSNVELPASHLHTDWQCATFRLPSSPSDPASIPVALSDTLTESNVLGMYTMSSDGSSARCEVDVGRESETTHNTGFISGFPPPSFLESISTITPLQWSCFWEEMENLSYSDSPNPPPPYCRFPERGGCTDDLFEETKMSGSKPSNPQSSSFITMLQTTQAPSGVVQS